MGAPTEACCFGGAGEDCLDLEFSECLSVGGLPMGVGSSCGGYSVTRCSDQACCWTPRGEEAPVCENMARGVCLGIGGKPLGHGVRCEAVELAGGCGLLGFERDCCLPDGSRVAALHPDYCAAVRGTPAAPGEHCPLPPIEEDCRFPEPDREVGPTWTLEGCARVGMGPAIAGPGLADYRAGYGVLVTHRGVRNDYRQPPCRQATTTVFLDARGYGSPVFCSHQQRFEGLRAHEGTVVLQPRSADPVTRPGYGVFLSAYNAPHWSEANVGSIKLRCFPVDV